jgi:histidine ammonia-lyase
MADTVVLGAATPLTLDAYDAVVRGGAPVAVRDGGRIAARRAALERRIAAGEAIYGVNTGYGAEAVRSVPPDALGRMQANTVAAHACGVGPDAPPEVVRGTLLLTVQAAAQGAGAYRSEVVDALAVLLNTGTLPRVPLMGSQSASDLLPAAALALALDVDFEAKDALFINTNAFSGALAVEALLGAERLIEHAEEVAAMSLQAVRGFPDAYDARLVALRPHAGALDSARHMRGLLEGSDLLRSADRPHDPFSLRALPQVHGAARDAIAALRRAVEIEIRSATDNPVVTEDGDVLSGGNFHGAPLGLPLDYVALALGEVATLSQLRSRFLVSGVLGTPRKLTPDPAERLGLLMLPGLAAALVSEARQRGAPASRESIGFDHMEDHVSMSALAGRQVLEVLLLVRRIVAVELLCAAQGLDYAGAARAAAPAQALHAAVRERIAFVDQDRPIDVGELLGLVG